MTARRGKSKEDLAREVAERDGISEGLICVYSTLEACSSFEVKGNRASQKLEVVRSAGKCLHYYFYLIDREFGFMHVRLVRCTGAGGDGGGNEGGGYRGEGD